MDRKWYKLVLVCLALLLTLDVPMTSSETRHSGSGEIDLPLIARRVTKDVGLVQPRQHDGAKGTAIFMFEENHADLAGQIEQAIMLARLHERYQLRDIALEGYLLGDPPIKKDWFVAMVSRYPPARRSVPVRLLREGEISAAEFMYLVYDDISLYPIEIGKEYNVTLDKRDAIAPLTYLYKLSIKSLKIKIERRTLNSKQAKRLVELKRGIEKASDETKNKLQNEYIKYVLSLDNWTAPRAEEFLDPEIAANLTSEKRVETLNQIRDRARRERIAITPEEKESFERYYRFWDGRAKANHTMARLTTEISNSAESPLLAMIVGKAHTDKLCRLLSSSDRSYAVLRSASLSAPDVSTQLPGPMFERKYRKLSPYSQGYMGILLDTFQGAAHKKPPSVLNQSFLRAKTELYMLTDQIVQRILTPPPGKPPTPPFPPAGAIPPYGFTNDDLSGQYVAVNPRQISIVDDEDRTGRAVLFPAVLNPNDPKNRKVLWVKAGLGSALLSRGQTQSVERMLFGALHSLKQSGRPNESVEDEAGRVQIAECSVAVLSLDRNKVESTSLGVI